PETPRTRQTFSWMAMSTRIDTRIAKAKAAPNWTVNTLVCVMKPGPMALVAIRNIAPIVVARVARRLALAAFASVLSTGVEAAPGCVSACLGFVVMVAPFHQ